jgi:D-alanyl-D-alanine carboxypeptidase/D-alanyl-D-alanine-endopeptidase (penicillin-binding protein 4)
VRKVRGRVLGDGSRYDGIRYVPTWKPEYVAQGQSGPLAALAVNHGFTRLVPTPSPAPSPATHAADALAVLLKERGVRVAGSGEGVAPSGAVAVTGLESLPVGKIVDEMLQESDNTTAELLTKELGYRFGGRGSTAAGTAVIRATLATLAPGTSHGVILHDGSGLDRADRATCSALTALLDTETARTSVLPSLPVAARSGTLAGRFIGTAAADRIRAKTGSLEDVAALSGYARDADGDDLRFTVLVHDDRLDVARRLLDRVGLLLVGYPQAPAPAELAAQSPSGTRG